MTDKTNELKCCPFCGSEDIRIWIEKANNEDEPEHWNLKHEIEQNDLFELYCNGCDFCSGKFCRPEHVIDKWNRRYDHAAAELRERVERLSQDEILKWGREHPSDETGLYAQGWIDASKAIFTALTEPADNIGEGANGL